MPVIMKFGMQIDHGFVYKIPYEMLSLNKQPNEQLNDNFDGWTSEVMCEQQTYCRQINKDFRKDIH